MSKENVKKLFAMIEKDAILRENYAKLMIEHQKRTEKALAASLIELGKSAGMQFSDDDLMAARAEMLDTSNSNAELNEKCLNAVSGGGGNKAAAVNYSLANFGIGCAIASIVYEVRDGAGQCANRFSADGSRKC